MKTAALEAGAVYRVARTYSGDTPIVVLDTRRRWRFRYRVAAPGGGAWFANGAPVPDGYRAPHPDVVGVPALELPNAGRGHGDDRLALLLDAARAVLAVGDLPDVVHLADVRAAITGAVADGPDQRLIGPTIATPQHIRSPWPGVRGRAPLPTDIVWTIHQPAGGQTP